MTYPILIDADTGIDDAMAIMFAVEHPDVDVRAITCVAGNTDLDGVVANTLKILDIVDAADIPVAAGAVRPLINTARGASHVHGDDGLGDIGLPEGTRTPVRVHAVEMLRQQLTEADEKLTIVALAPLTNIALLLRMYPECAERIERILFMGGSASVGNATPVAEFNIWHDPEAARVVLDSGVPLTMYGLDVFNTVAVEQGEIDNLKVSQEKRANTLGRLLDFRSASDDGAGVGFGLIGDAGAVIALVAERLMQVENHPVQVELTSGITRGQTVVDRRAQAGEDVEHGLAEEWPDVDVVLSADADAVVRLFLDTVVG